MQVCFPGELLFQSFEKLLCLEVVWNRLVVASDDFVYLLFPRRLRVLARLDRAEEFSQGNDNHGQEVVWHLKHRQSYVKNF